MASADLVQTNGLGLSLASAMKRLIAVCSSTIEVKTALEALPGKLGKPTFDRVGPGAGSRGEVEGEARMSRQPCRHLGVLVGGVVVKHHMDRLGGRDLALDSIEKANEFLMPVALHAAPDDLAFEDIEGGKQGGGAVSLVIMGHRGAAPLLHRQTRLGAVERL